WARYRRSAASLRVQFKSRKARAGVSPQPHTPVNTTSRPMAVLALFMLSSTLCSWASFQGLGLAQVVEKLLAAGTTVEDAPNLRLVPVVRRLDLGAIHLSQPRVVARRTQGQGGLFFLDGLRPFIKLLEPGACGVHRRLILDGLQDGAGVLEDAEDFLDD